MRPVAAASAKITELNSRNGKRDRSGMRRSHMLLMVCIRFHLRSMVGHGLLQHFILALLNSAQHPAGQAKSGVGHTAAPFTLLTGVHHHDQLVMGVSQLLGDIFQQSGLACEQHSAASQSAANARSVLLQPYVQCFEQ